MKGGISIGGTKHQHTATTDRTHVTAKQTETIASKTTPVASYAVVEEELSEVLSGTSSVCFSDSDREDDVSLTDTASDDETEEKDDDHASVFEGEPPSVIIVAVVVSSFHEDEGAPPISTISVLQELFAGLEDDFDAENELLEKDETVVSALTGVLTN